MEDHSRYHRQEILKQIGREGQTKLQGSSVAVVGLGALGSVSSQLLARAGVGKLRLIDRDFPEMNNLQRQVLYDEEDVTDHRPKAEAAAQKLKRINAGVRIEPLVKDLNPETIVELFDGMDLVVDGTDNFETRFLINDYALQKSIPWIYGGALKTEGMMYVILPGEGPCLRCLFSDTPKPGDFQTCDQAGILASAAHVIASMQFTEAVKILTGMKNDVTRALWKIDLWENRFQALEIKSFKDDPCEGCREKHYPYLAREIGMRTVTLCGRNAVQIYRGEGAPEIDFGMLASKLSGLVKVEYNDYIFNILPGSYRISVFSDGRAIIKGTEDAVQAKSLYSKYVGN